MAAVAFGGGGPPFGGGGPPFGGGGLSSGRGPQFGGMPPLAAASRRIPAVRRRAFLRRRRAWSRLRPWFVRQRVSPYSSRATKVEPLVPGFGVASVSTPPPGFGAEGQLFTILITEEDRREAERSFRYYDRNQDGKIDAEVLAAAATVRICRCTTGIVTGC